MNQPSLSEPPNAHEVSPSRRGPSQPQPSLSPGAETCDLCGSTDLWWRNCKLLCRSCRAIVKSCADL